MFNEKVKVMTKAIMFSALAVGTLLVGKKYYELRNLQLKKNENKDNLNYFIVDLVIDNNCKDKILSVGVNQNKKSKDFIGHQCIRFGCDGKLKKLIAFSKNKDLLIYYFEDNTQLILKKKSNNKIIYVFATDDDIIIKEIDDNDRNQWKPISLDSLELDFILELK